MMQVSDAPNLQIELELLGATDPRHAFGTVTRLQTRYPFLCSGFSPADPAKARADASLFARMQSDYRAFMQALAACSDDARRAAHTYFDGIRPDIRAAFPDSDFSAAFRPGENPARGHQLMVFVTGICNLACSYCFSQDIDRREISPDQLRRIFQWAKAQNCDVVTPCGGEPLVYSHLGLFLDLVREYGMSTYFASNATVPLADFTDDQLSAIDLITFHLTAALWANPAMMRVFEENLELAKARGIDIIARANIVSPDMNVDKWFDVIDRHGLRRMNVALTIPTEAAHNTFVPADHFASHADVVRHIIEMAVERDINLSFAKPIPPCVFTEEEAAWLLQRQGLKPLCNVWEDSGTRNVCISPDMKISPCLGVANPKVDFSDSLTWEDMERVMGGEIMRDVRKPLFDRCSGCFLYARNLCQGACLSYKCSE